MAAVIVAAPAKSIRPRRPPVFGSSEGISVSTRSPIGTLIRNVQRQLIHWVITPPRKTPAVPPAGADAPQKPIALPSSFGSLERPKTTGHPAGAGSAAAPPPKARAARSAPPPGGRTA